MFRLQDRQARRWLLRFQDGGANPLWTWNKAEALVLPQDKREFWEEDEDYKIIPLEEDELMSRRNQPRLEGF